MESGQPNPGQSFGSGNGTINQPIKASCPTTLKVQAGTPGQSSLSAVDPDGVITAVTTLSAAIPGVTLSQIALGPNASALLEVAETTAVGIYPFTVVFKNAETPVQQAICTVRINVTPEISRPDDYYERAQGLEGHALKAALHEIIKIHDHLSYATIWDVIKDVDEDPSNPQNVILLYTGRSQSKNKNSGVDSRNPDFWNREHVWSRSHGLGPRGPAGRFTDAHNLRATDASVNATRGNKDFDEGGSMDQEATGNRSDADSWEPRAAVRGDISRSMFYMAVRYEQTGNKPDLVLVNHTGTTGAKFGKLCTLLKWHEADPPDAWEKRRNDRIHLQWQGNRNPFVDHPEWARAIWGNQCP